ERPIYLDYHATTPVDPRVLESMLPWFGAHFGNPSSTHLYGQEASRAIREAGAQVAALVGAEIRPGVQHQVVFTSGATESINLALNGYVQRHQPTDRPFRLGVLELEHKAVLDSCKFLQQAGQAEIRPLKVDACGQLDLTDLEAACSAGLDLLVVMAANNEVGTIYPLAAIGAIAGQNGVPFFCDASQAAGKIPLDFESWGISLMALTAHKMYGPKGSGAFVIRRGTQLSAQIHGGGHQQGLRSGTLNVPAIVGLGTACSLRQQEMGTDEARIARLRDQLQQSLQSAIPGLVVNGDQASRLAGNLHLSLPDVPNDAMVAQLDGQLAFSTSSACSSGLEASSHVLSAIGLAPELQRGALRLSLGKQSGEAEAEQAAVLLIEAYQRIKARLEGVKTA
ncbi:MAG TPA: cysteine desulfurase family protein, partial [Candidatus Obscuribacterales bacterium]